MMPSSKAVVFARQIAKKKITPSLFATTRFLSTPDNPPEPLPNRPLRGSRPSSNPAATAKPLNLENTLSNNTFLEQFKLSINQETTQQPIPPQEEEPSPPQDSEEIFKTMKEQGLISNAVSMLDGLCKDGLVQEAMKLFSTMREKGTIPEVVIYTAVVDGFCKARKVDEAKRIFKKMKSNGISPNAFSYGVLVQGLYGCGMVDDAVEYCVEMMESGHSPNVGVFVGLVEGLCREKGVEEARVVIERLKEKGFGFDLKVVKEFMEKTAPFPTLASEAIFKKKPLEKPF